MERKFIYGAALSALMLSACSQDSVLDMPSANNDAIAYGVTSGNTTRAVQSLCNTSMPKMFKVSAYKAGTTENYFDADVQSLIEGSNPVKYEGTYRYWPDFNLDFHAWANDQDTYSYNETEKSGKFTNFTPKADAKDQVDLVYASMPNQERGKTVNLNFRHALSQIVFNARNESGLEINISGVKVANVNTVGTYIMKNSDTSDNYENHNEDSSVEDNRKGMGEWQDVAASALGEYTTTFATKAISGTENVTLTDADHNGNADGSLLLLPQEQNAWDPSQKNEEFIGAYFLVNVKISDPNLLDENGNATVIWDRETAVPVKVDWKQGVRYRYTFVFTKNGGGYEPDPNDPKPVLNGIELEVSTDDFVPAPGTELPEEPEQPTPETYNFNITLNGNGGTPSATDFSYTAENGAKLPLAEYTATREEYDFIGWSTNPDATAAEEIILNKDNLNVTLYAVWESQYQTITLSFDTNGETAIEPMTQKVKKGEQATFELPKKVETANESYALEGWLTEAPAQKIIASDADDVEGLLLPGKRDFKASKDMTLYAIYRETEAGSGGGGDKPVVKD